ncbi:hypothetical protein MRX96_046451 [Rhipicephalus microplus]
MSSSTYAYYQEEPRTPKRYFNLGVLSCCLGGTAVQRRHHPGCAGLVATGARGIVDRWHRATCSPEAYSSFSESAPWASIWPGRTGANARRPVRAHATTRLACAPVTWCSSNEDTS